MFEARFSQRPAAATGPSWSAVAQPAMQSRRRRLRRVKLVSAAMLATLVSTAMVLVENRSGGTSPWGIEPGLLVMWLVLFLGLSLFARATARLAMRLVGGKQRAPAVKAAAMSDHEVFASMRQDPQLSGDVQALLDAGAARDIDLPPMFTAPRYCRYL